jgi:hypothetical protein
MSIEAMKQAYQVPLVEQLESVPADARLVIDDADGMGARFIPVGRICREAAAALRTAIEQAEKSQDIKSGIETVAAKGGLLPKQEPVAWLQIGLAPFHDGDVIARTTKPKEWNPKWWRFEPLYTTPPAAQSQDLNGGHQLDVAGHASTATITKWSYRDCGSEGWFIAETVAAPGGLLPQQEPVAWDDLLGAVARGWGHSKNAHKEMDSDLALAIAEEVKSLLKEKNT